MALPRESTFLPSIKCSSCGNQVLLSMMGEHICAGSGQNGEPSPPMEASERFENRCDQFKYNKYSRTPPPLETSSAGQSFMHRGQLTPVSQAGSSRNVSPIGNPTRPGRLDGFFQPAAAKGSAPTPTSPAPRSPVRRPGGYGGFDEPSIQGADNQLGRPFTTETPTTLGPAESKRRPTAPKNGFPQRKDSLEKWVPPPDEVDVNSRLPRQNGYGGFGAEGSSYNYGGIKRSETYPELSQPAPVPARMPSEPGTRPEQSRRGYGHDRKKSMGPDTSRRPPPRKSLIPDAAINNNGSVDIIKEFGDGNPYHTPTDSMSSGYSDFSVTSRNTAQTTPEREDFRTDSGRPNDYQHSQSRSRPHDLRIDPSASSRHRFGPELVESPHASSPMYDGQSPRGGGTAYHTPAYPESASDYRNDNSMDRYGPPAQVRDDYTWKAAPVKPMPLPRGDCKACGIPITGKSISSADGRLTGKYHKACFVCTDCKAPFSSSVFYVLDDKPYCEHDYHYRNGSLCGHCQTGIEGQYVEDEELYKYHIGCFCCRDCGQSLSDGYFEVEGYAYCEKDAWQRVQANGYFAPEPEPEPEPEPQTQPQPEGDRYQTGPRGAYGSRPTNGVVGLPSRPSVRGRTKPAPSTRPGGLPQDGLPNNRLRMNKRMTRFGNMNTRI